MFGLEAPLEGVWPKARSKARSAAVSKTSRSTHRRLPLGSDASPKRPGLWRGRCVGCKVTKVAWLASQHQTSPLDAHTGLSRSQQKVPQLIRPEHSAKVVEVVVVLLRMVVVAVEHTSCPWFLQRRIRSRRQRRSAGRFNPSQSAASLAPHDFRQTRPEAAVASGRTTALCRTRRARTKKNRMVSG